MYRYLLTDDVRDDLARIEELRCRLDSRDVLPRRWIGRLRRELEAASIAASTSMEGVPVTVEEVRRILAGDRPREVSEQDAALVSGYRDAMSFVLRRGDDLNFTWQTELVLALHDKAMAGSFSAGAGRLRTTQVHLAVESLGRLVYTPPAPERVPALVDELAEWAGSSEEVPAPVRAALVHVRLAGVHPFRDGNGRVARILASLVMYRSGYRLPEFTSLEEWWGDHRDAYYAAFECLGERWDPDADATPFVSAHVRAQRCQVEALSLTQAVQRQIWTALEDVATEDVAGSPRLADALYDAFFGRVVTNRYYRELAGVTSVTASHDLQRLQASRLLEGRGAGRSSAYHGTGMLIARVAEAARLETPSAEQPLDAQRAEVVAGLAARLRDGCDEWTGG